MRAITDLNVDGRRDLEAADDGDVTIGGLHVITRNTNYWFEREVAAIERDAEQRAGDWASKGLPRHDVPRTEPLEPEQVLAMKCAQLFCEWQQRVTTKLQDAVEEAARQCSEQVGVLRSKLARMDAVALELRERGERIERIRRETEQDQRPVRYEPLIKPVWFWIGAIALGLVEFMANFPVFRLLLPMNSALAKVASGIADRVDPESLAAGMMMLIAEWATHVDAVVVALVAVIVLVALGKFAGRSARAYLSLSPDDHPTASRTIRAHQREQIFNSVASVVGISFVLGFLFISRGDIAETAATRVRQDSAAVASAEARLIEAQAQRDDAAIVRIDRERQELRDILLQHQEDERYATTVERNNLSILLLNIALVITAAVLGYAAAHADLSEKRGEHPDLIKLRDLCNRLRTEQLELGHGARVAAAQARASASRVDQLLGAQPLHGWESKLRRLESVIPRFRGENARLRGLDPANIRAFDERPRLDLPAVDERSAASEPAGFADVRAELRDLAHSHDRLATVSPGLTELSVIA